MNLLTLFINKRSKREILLFKILWICCCFFICFEYFAYPSFLSFQAYKHSKNLKSVYDNKEIEDFLSYFNHTSTPHEKLLQTIQDNTLSIQEINNKDAKHILFVQGTIHPTLFFPMLQKLSSPTLYIQSFSLDSTGDFSLTLKNQKITTLSPSTPLKASPQEIFDKFSIPISSFAFNFYIPPKPQNVLILEAIFNQKAKINGLWIGLGENIQGYMLKEIHSHFITLEKDSKPLNLHLKEKRILQ